MPGFKKPAKAGTAWTEQDKLHLTFFWGVRPLSQLCRELDRSPWSVVEAAKKLNLGPTARGTWSLNGLSRYSGFSAEKILKAAEVLGMNLERAYTGADAITRNKKLTRRRSISDDQADRLIEYMSEHEYIRANNKGDQRTARGLWGVGLKPDQCVECSTTSSPHYAKGRCKHCYMKRFKRSKSDQNDRDFSYK